MSEMLAPPQSELEVKALADKYGLTDRTVAIAYFSFAEPDSFVGAYEPGGRITRLIEFLPLPVRGADLLDAIAAIDENGPRLVANYRQRFPDLYADVARFYADQEAADTEALAWLLGAASLTIGMEQSDLERALLPLQVAVMVDTVVVERDGRYLFDGLRLLRSLISYRIADVPREVLARSIFESLGDFAATALRRLMKDWRADAIICAGDLFAGNNILRVRTRGALISMRVPIHFSAIGRS
jgi:hypothetical protein